MRRTAVSGGAARSRFWVAAMAIAASALAACSEQANRPGTMSDPEAGQRDPDAGATDSGTTPDARAQRDAALANPGGAGSSLCDELGLSPVGWNDAPSGDGLDAVAGDFSARTLLGTYTFSERFTGCESYVFVVHLPQLGPAADQLFATSFEPWFQDGPRNVQYFMLSEAADAAEREALMLELEDAWNASLDKLLKDEDEAAFFRSRVHFVTDRASEIEGSVGAFVRSELEYASDPGSQVDIGDGRGLTPPPAPVVFGIDRAQRFDAGDNLSPAVGLPPRLGMAAYLGHFYNYRGELEQALEQSGAEVIDLVDEQTTRRVFEPTVALPSQSAMAGFDRLEVDVVIDCQARSPFGCSEWDRIASVSFCTNGTDSADCSDRAEIARWITPYWRRGRQHYLIDATPMLGLLRAGGSQRFHVELGPDFERATEWRAHVSLRLHANGEELLAQRTELAFRGGAFDASYNMREPFHFEPTAAAERVELVTILSGHGQTTGNNCAEWCDHRHAFAVNGDALPVIRFEDAPIGDPMGCARQAAHGVIPGQWGNWTAARAYWCPGLAVEARRTDITALVRRGEDNVLGYSGHLGSADPAGGDIALSAYIVEYRAP